MLRSTSIALMTLFAGLWACGTFAADPEDSADASVTLTISSESVHQMQSGVGASWHSILYPTVGAGGSAFGGSPPLLPRHEALWNSMERHADWLGLKFIRLEMDWRQFAPRKGEFTWDSPEMKIVDRICRWAQCRGADVMLQCMWLNVDWLAFPEFAGDPALEIASAPADLDAFAEGWVALLQELQQRRGYRCIRWINLVNEPGYYWWHLPTTLGRAGADVEQMRYLAEAADRVRAAIQRAGLDVRIMGPDLVDLPELGRLADYPWFHTFDDLDFHSYRSVFDFEDPAKQAVPGGYLMGPRLEQTIARYAPESHAAGKGFYLSEAGTQVYGYKADDPNPGSFRASLKDTELLIRSLASGIDGFNHWSFANRGDMDGQWQLIDTWDRDHKSWLSEALPHEPSYFVLGLATRHVPKRAIILKNVLQGGQVDGQPRVWAAALRSPKDQSLTVLVVNDAERPWTLSIGGPGVSRPLVAIHSAANDSVPRQLRYEPLPSADGVHRVQVPPFSLTIVTDTPIESSQPGRF